MQRKLGSILLVAGTTIGSGMIALPMMLAKLGLIPSIGLMLVIWSLMYYTALINLELNLQAGDGKPLGTLGRIFSGRISEALGFISLKLLSYSLLAVFIYGGASVIQRLMATSLGHEYSFTTIATYYAFGTMAILLLPLKVIDYTNRFLFIALLLVLAILLTGLGTSIHWHDLPLVATSYSDCSVWYAAVPVVFTSFGFQVVFHTLTNYCNNDEKMLKQAFFWGSFIPAVVYIIWTSGVLSVVYHYNPAFYDQIMVGKADVGDLVKELSTIAHWQTIQMLVWWISILAILTSVIGVGIGLVDSLNHQFDRINLSPVLSHPISVLITVLPAYFVAIFIPNAFISVLGFAGMILAIIAVLLPVYLFYKGKFKTLHYPELKYSTLIILSALAGIAVILCELKNMF